VSAAGRAVLRVLDQEKRQEHCHNVGIHLLTRLRELQERHSVIGDVRGSGLMLGIEMVTDRTSKVLLHPSRQGRTGPLSSQFRSS
jgi:alanine-glyoxylate transaminase/(R)-3-amino-2-methylpropionate-pyruvate transaminase